MVFSSEYNKYVLDVQNTMLSCLEYKSKFLKKIANYAPISNGKMVRAVLLFAFAKLSGNLSDECYKKAVNFGAVIELLHLATLVHDDVIDFSDKRRGKPTLHSEYGNRLAILAGDLLFSVSFKLMSFSGGSAEILQAISLACENLVCGEMEEENLTGNVKITREDYLVIIHKKTAELFQVACKIGAIISNSKFVDIAEDFGLNIGMSFQIIDDAIDYFSTEKKSKKMQYGDLISKKCTLPILLLRAACDKEELQKIDSYFTNSDKILNPGDIEEISKMMERYEINEKMREESWVYLSKAQENLGVFPKSADREMILSFMNDFNIRYS